MLSVRDLYALLLLCRIIARGVLVDILPSLPILYTISYILTYIYIPSTLYYYPYIYIPRFQDLYLLILPTLGSPFLAQGSIVR